MPPKSEEERPIEESKKNEDKPEVAPAETPPEDPPPDTPSNAPAPQITPPPQLAKPQHQDDDPAVNASASIAANATAMWSRMVTKAPTGAGQVSVYTGFTHVELPQDSDRFQLLATVELPHLLQMARAPASRAFGPVESLVIGDVMDNKPIKISNPVFLDAFHGATIGTRALYIRVASNMPEVPLLIDPMLPYSEDKIGGVTDIIKQLGDASAAVEAIDPGGVARYTVALVLAANAYASCQRGRVMISNDKVLPLGSSGPAPSDKKEPTASDATDKSRSIEGPSASLPYDPKAISDDAKGKFLTRNYGMSGSAEENGTADWSQTVPVDDYKNYPCFFESYEQFSPYSWVREQTTAVRPDLETSFGKKGTPGGGVGSYANVTERVYAGYDVQISELNRNILATAATMKMVPDAFLRTITTCEVPSEYIRINGMSSERTKTRLTLAPVDPNILLTNLGGNAVTPEMIKTYRTGLYMSPGMLNACYSNAVHITDTAVPLNTVISNLSEALSAWNDPANAPSNSGSANNPVPFVNMMGTLVTQPSPTDVSHIACQELFAPYIESTGLQYSPGVADPFKLAFVLLSMRASLALQPCLWTRSKHTLTLMIYNALVPFFPLVTELIDKIGWAKQGDVLLRNSYALNSWRSCVPYTSFPLLEPDQWPQDSNAMRALLRDIIKWLLDTSITVTRAVPDEHYRYNGRSFTVPGEWYLNSQEYQEKTTPLYFQMIRAANFVHRWCNANKQQVGTPVKINEAARAKADTLINDWTPSFCAWFHQSYCPLIETLGRHPMFIDDCTVALGTGQWNDIYVVREDSKALKAKWGLDAQDAGRRLITLPANTKFSVCTPQLAGGLLLTAHTQYSTWYHGRAQPSTKGTMEDVQPMFDYYSKLHCDQWVTEFFAMVRLAAGRSEASEMTARLMANRMSDDPLIRVIMARWFRLTAGSTPAIAACVQKMFGLDTKADDVTRAMSSRIDSNVHSEPRIFCPEYHILRGGTDVEPRRLLSVFERPHVLENAKRYERLFFSPLYGMRPLDKGIRVDADGIVDDLSFLSIHGTPNHYLAMDNRTFLNVNSEDSFRYKYLREYRVYTFNQEPARPVIYQWPAHDPAAVYQRLRDLYPRGVALIFPTDNATYQLLKTTQRLPGDRSDDTLRICKYLVDRAHAVVIMPNTMFIRQYVFTSRDVMSQQRAVDTFLTANYGPHEACVRSVSVYDTRDQPGEMAGQLLYAPVLPSNGVEMPTLIARQVDYNVPPSPTMMDGWRRVFPKIAHTDESGRPYVTQGNLTRPLCDVRPLALRTPVTSYKVDPTKIVELFEPLEETVVVQ